MRVPVGTLEKVKNLLENYQYKQGVLAMSLRRSIWMFGVWVLLVVLPGTYSWADKTSHVSFATTMLDLSKDNLNQKFNQLIRENKSEELRALIASGVNLNTADTKRVSPIHYVAFLGHIDALRWMIPRGVNLSAAVFGGWTPLHYAAFAGHVPIGNLLVAMGVPVDIRDVGGESPLFYAVEAGRTDMVRWLVANGANVDHVNNSKLTPVTTAIETGNKEIIEFLQKHSKQSPENTQNTSSVPQGQ
ncbi:MAG: ankef1 [Magnetococcales bacterium]|nr:ankef1 [Magnetococcales bacterium]